MRIAVIGAGIIGLTCAEELIRARHDVLIYDSAPATGATHAAAGMLAPAGEAWHGEEKLLALGLASAHLWPGFAERLGSLSGVDVDFRAAGTVLVARDHNDLDVVKRTATVLTSSGISCSELDRKELRSLEPTLSGRIAGGLALPGDNNVNPRAVATALMRILGNRLIRSAARPCTGGVLLDNGVFHGADAVVIATGADPANARLRAVKGEIIRVRMTDPPTRVIRGLVEGQPVYAVPRADNVVVIGATEEEHTGEAEATVGGVELLLRSARALLPGIDKATVLDITARNRPGTPDNGPLIGPATDTGLGRASLGTVILATGHYRGGVLLAPVTATAVRAHIEGNAVPESALPFLPDRFGPPNHDTKAGSR